MIETGDSVVHTHAHQGAENASLQQQVPALQQRLAAKSGAGGAAATALASVGMC